MHTAHLTENHALCSREGNHVNCHPLPQATKVHHAEVSRRLHRRPASFGNSSKFWRVTLGGVRLRGRVQWFVRSRGPLSSNRKQNIMYALFRAESLVEKFGMKVQGAMFYCWGLMRFCFVCGYLRWISGNVSTHTSTVLHCTWFREEYYVLRPFWFVLNVFAVILVYLTRTFVLALFYTIWGNEHVLRAFGSILDGGVFEYSTEVSFLL